MTPLFRKFPSLALVALSGCVSMPNGPSIMALPGSNQSFDQFRNDDAFCQQYASSQIGGTTANEAAANTGITNAVVGTALGAAAGAALGGGRGAAIGAGTGLVAGSLVGSSAASGSMYEVQQRFDSAYIQCMYAKGHQVPVSGEFSDNTPAPPMIDDTMYNQNSQDDQTQQIPPPPPGLPPEPPMN